MNSLLSRLLGGQRPGRKSNRRSIQPCRPALEVLESRITPAIRTWTGLGADDLWSNAANWDTAVPVDGDDVRISATANSAEVLYDASVLGNGVTINSLTSDGTNPVSEPLRIAGDTLTLSGAGPFTFSNTLTLNNGVIDGTGDIAINGGLTWTNGTMSGSGTTTILAGTTAAFAPGDKFLGRTLINLGTIDYSGAVVRFGTSTDSIGVIDNNGIFNFAGNGFQKNGSFPLSAGHAFNNTGTFNLLSNGLREIVGVQFNNTGSVNVNVPGGILELNGGGSSSGDFTLASDAFVDLRSTNYILESGASFLGAGFLRLGGVSGGGTTTIAGAVDAGNVRLFNAALNGAGDLTVSTFFDWQAGTMTGSGQTIIAPTATMTITGNDTFLGRTLVSQGTINYIGTKFEFGSTNLVGVGVLNNNGVFNATGNGTIVKNGSSLSTGHAFNNAGTFNRSGAGTNEISGIQFINSGTVNVLAGTLTLNSTLSNFSGTTLTGGVYYVAGTLKFTGANIVTNAATIVLDGATAQIVNQSNADALTNFATNAAGGRFTIQNSRNITTSGFINAGLIAVAPASTFTVSGGQAYVQTGGTTTLNGTLTATSADILGGLLQGNGTVNGEVSNAGVVGPGVSPGMLTINGNYTQSNTGSLNVEIGGLTAGTQFDGLEVTGAAVLNGILNVALIDGFTPAGPDTFRIVNAGSLTGAFATVNGLFAGGRFVPLYDATGAVLDANFVPIASNDTDATLEDTAVTTNVLTNDSDPEADALSVVAVGTSTQGVTPVNNGDGTITYTPPSNFFGSDSYTYSLRDAVGNEATATVTITISDINDAPTLDSIPDPAILEDAATQTINLTGITAGGGESQTLTVTATSSNPGLIPDPTVTYTSPASTGSLSFTPAANQSGTATITVTVADSGDTANGGVNTFSRTFVVTVTAVNDSPTLDPIADPAAIPQNAGTQTINLSGITAGGGESQTLTVTATSSNPSLIPDPTVTYTSPDSIGLLSFTPAANQSGTAVITVTVTDDGGAANGGVNTFSRTFTVTVSAVNGAPTLDSIPDPAAILEDAGTQTVDLAGISAGTSESQTLTVTAVSSNPGLIPNPTVTYTSPDLTGSLSYTPVANLSGTAVITVTVTDNGGTANGGVDTLTRTFTVTVMAVNDVPTLDPISDPSVILEDDGAQTVDLTGIAAGGESQTLTVTATSSNPGLIADPTVTYTSPNATGSLSYAPVGNQSGTAVITVTVTDNGGTANGGVETFTRTFTVTVAPLNDSLVSSVNPLPAVSAPSFAVAWSGTDGSGGSELAAFDIFVSVDGGDPTRWLQNTAATTGVFIGELGKHYSFFSVGIDHAGGRERRPLIPDAETDTALFQRDLPPIAEDNKNPAGVLVSALLGTAMSDADPGALRGVAITGVSGSGTWQFSADGKKWKPLTGPSEVAAWLLPESFRVRFVPAANFVGAAGLLFRGWDRTSGAAGTQATVPVAELASPFSADGGFAQVQVTPVNDRPFLPTSPVPRLLPTPRSPAIPAGQLVGSLLLSATDVDGDTLGIAVMGTSGTGVWQFSLDAAATWTNVGAVSGAAALLLGPADLVRFTPTAGAAGKATLTVKAWDQTSGQHGNRVNATLASAVAFSKGAVAAATKINGAPTLAGANPTVTMVEDQSPNNGFVVETLLTGRFTDDTGALRGVAATSASELVHGVWQFSTDGKTWRALGAVSETAALLLRSTDRIRFVPNADFNGTSAATLTYKAWDQTFGAAGAFADVSAFSAGAFFSNASLTATLSITPVADRPVLDVSVTPALSSFLPGGTPSSARVADLLGNRVHFADHPATGIAVTAVAGPGAWEFSLDAGNTWSAVGIVSASSGRLLNGDARVRFVPNATFRGVASIRYKVWDETVGTVGALNVIAAASTAFSKEIGTATVAVNNAPVLSPGSVVLPAISEDSKNPAGFAVSSVLGVAFSDGDGHRVPRGIAATALTGAADGIWQFSTNGGSKWSPVGAVGNASALLLRSTDRLRFLPATNFNGTVSVTFKAWDQTTGVFGGRGDASINGGSSAFSTGTRTATIAVTSINDRPAPRTGFALGQIHLPSVPVGTVSPAGVRVEDLVSAGIIDPDGDALGIAVFGLTGTTNGQWQFSTDGSAWQSIGTVSAASALLLAHSDFIRFVPNATLIGSAVIKFRAWDQTKSVAHARVALSSSLLAGSLSLADFLAPVWVNTSPVLSTS